MKLKDRIINLSPDELAKNPRIAAQLVIALARSAPINKGLLGGVMRALYKLYVITICNTELMTDAPLGEGLCLPHPFGIIINRTATIGRNVTIFHQVTIGVNEHHGDLGVAPTIGDNVFIGAGAKIIGPITVGTNVRIGANAVVTKDVPDNATVVGFNRMLLRN